MVFGVEHEERTLPQQVTPAAAPREGRRQELEVLVAELVGHARDMIDTQRRVPALLRANHAVIGELALDTVLRRIAEAACELVGASYGAVGIGPPEGGGLEELLHVGLDVGEITSMGSLPQGRGLLGALIEDPHAIRLRDIDDDVPSVGFPQGHPPMRGFLGVPIRVGDEVFGILYLASLAEGGFSAEDEALVTALAATAGVAIDNARLHGEAKQRQRWLEASTDVTRQLLSLPGNDGLRVVAGRVAELAGADAVAVVLPEAADDVRVAVAVGAGAESLRDTSYPLAGTLVEVVFETGRPAVVDGSEQVGPYAGRRVAPDLWLPVGPVMVLPLAGAEAVRGALVVSRSPGRAGFRAAEVEMATGFAYHATVALELTDGRRGARRMELLEDRARIARDLHDHVIQQLFAAGMTLQGAATTIGDVPGAEMIEGVVDAIDDAIRQIRTSIFQLRPHHPGGGGTRGVVLRVVGELTPLLGGEPEVRFTGPVDAVCDESLTADISAVVREGLTNVARHSGASHAAVGVLVSETQLTVTVEDDGCGAGSRTRASGLENLTHRALARRGSLHVGEGAEGRGTRLVWQVPVDRDG